MWTRLAARLRAWWHRREVQATVDEELEFHVEMEGLAHEAEGLSADEAHRQALADLGGTEQVREDILEVRTPRLMLFAWRVRQDLRYACRTFARTPLAVLSVVLVLACGIGLNTAVFSAVDALFFAPLPVPNASAVVYVSGPKGVSVDYGVFRDRAHGAVLSVAPTSSYPDMTLASPDVHLRSIGERVSANYFETLGLSPELGHFFVPSDDDERTADRAVILSDALWRQRFGADPNVIGRQVTLNDQDATIIGVAPPGFHGISLPWRPSQLWATSPQRRANGLPITRAQAFAARLAPGVSPASLIAMVADRPGQPNPRSGVYELLWSRPAVGPLACAELCH